MQRAAASSVSKFLMLLKFVVALVVGALSGFIAALCGVGGGILLVPAFVYLFELPQKNAVATSLMVIVLTSIAASAKNASSDLINWRLALPTAVGAVIVAWFAAELLKRLSNLTLTRIFAVVLILAGVSMLFKRPS